MSVIRNDIYESLMMAVTIMRFNKFRSALTVVGIVIGVWVVIVIASIISGIDVAVKKEIESVGTRSIFITKFSSRINLESDRREERQRSELTPNDAIAVSQLPAIETAVPVLDITTDYFGRRIPVEGGGKRLAKVVVQGTLPEYERAGIQVISEGRFFSRLENGTRQKVCAISRSIADDLFPFGTPIGRHLKVGGQEFRVIGILEKGQHLSGTQADDQHNTIYLPFEVARQFNPQAQGLIIMAVARPDRMDEAKEQITELLRIRRQVPYDQPDNFGMATADSMIEQFHAITFGVTLAMISLSSLGLMVGGVGVMNIMLVSVTERTREIGIRKAVGARRRDILQQFLIEAMILTGFGGLLGLAFGWLTTLPIGYLIPSYVPLWAPLAGLIASIGIGLVFGLWPAWKAARLAPIDALKYE
ncbi:MAG: ABC transporter permease [Pyrinomonadaceae bacterium]